MSSHRSRPSSRRGSGRTRALVSLGAVGFLAIGLGAQGTFAFWTDSATASPANFSSGTLDIGLDNKLTGPGGSTPVAGFGLTNLFPGESQAVAFPIANAGSVGLTYSISGSASGGLAPVMQYSIFPGAASNTTPGGVRTGSCTGTALASNQVLTATNATVVVGPRALAAAASESICVIAKLDANANNSFQGMSTSASLVFDAKQVGAP